MGAHEVTLEEDEGIRRPPTQEKHKAEKGKWGRPLPHQTQCWGCCLRGKEMGSPKGKVGSVFPFFLFFSL